jgi:hypothetical protein
MNSKENFNEFDKLIEKAYDVMGKKLTTKMRKKLKKSTFCGPNRSFPVNDCQHAATAKAYLNRSNFSAATKKRIASCINRRAKELGCKPGKPAKAKGSFEGFLREDALANSKIFESTKKLVEESIENKGMELTFEEEVNCDCEK